MLAANTIDVGMAVGEVNVPHVLVTRLAREPLVAVLPVEHPLADRQTIDLRDLAGDDFVGFSTSQIHDYIARACITAGFAPRLSLQGPQVHTMIHLVAAGLGVTLAPRCDCAQPVDGVVFRALDPPAEEVEINALQHRWRRNAVAGALVADVVQASDGRPDAGLADSPRERPVPGLGQCHRDDGRAGGPDDTERDGESEVPAEGLGD